MSSSDLFGGPAAAHCGKNHPSSAITSERTVHHVATFARTFPDGLTLRLSPWSVVDVVHLRGSAVQSREIVVIRNFIHGRTLATSPIGSARLQKISRQAAA